MIVPRYEISMDNAEEMNVLKTTALGYLKKMYDASINWEPYQRMHGFGSAISQCRADQLNATLEVMYFSAQKRIKFITDPQIGRDARVRLQSHLDSMVIEFTCVLARHLFPIKIMSDTAVVTNNGNMRKMLNKQVDCATGSSLRKESVNEKIKAVLLDHRDDISKQEPIRSNNILKLILDYQFRVRLREKQTSCFFLCMLDINHFFMWNLSLIIQLTPYIVCKETEKQFYYPNIKAIDSETHGDFMEARARILGSTGETNEPLPLKILKELQALYMSANLITYLEPSATRSGHNNDPMIEVGLSFVVQYMTIIARSQKSQPETTDVLFEFLKSRYVIDGNVHDFSASLRKVGQFFGDVSLEWLDIETQMHADLLEERKWQVRLARNKDLSVNEKALLENVTYKRIVALGFPRAAAERALRVAEDWIDLVIVWLKVSFD